MSVWVIFHVRIRVTVCISLKKRVKRTIYDLYCLHSFNTSDVKVLSKCDGTRTLLDINYLSLFKEYPIADLKK